MSLRPHLALGAYLASVPLANWAVNHVGLCAAGSPCVVPVWPGVLAPSGVLLVGVALTLRDLVQEHFGERAALAALLLGTVLSALVASPALAVASAVAFGASEAVDFVVYTATRARGRHVAIALSGAAGLLVDSVVFLTLAFGSLELLLGQVVGKAWAVSAATAFAWLRARRAA